MLAKGFEIHVRGEVRPDLLDELEQLTAVEVPAQTVLRGVLELIEVRRLGNM